MTRLVSTLIGPRVEWALLALWLVLSLLSW